MLIDKYPWFFVALVTVILISMIIIAIAQLFRTNGNKNEIILLNDPGYKPEKSWEETLMTRLSRQDTSMIVIMSRLHEQDEKGDFTYGQENNREIS